MVYAVVRAGGRQEKVEVGTVVVLDRIAAGEDGTIRLAPVLLVDGDTITHDAKALEKVTVTAEVLGDERGKKIVIQKFKNKTGYKKRQGHRSELTRVKITGIGSNSRSADKKSTAKKSDTAEKSAEKKPAASATESE